MITTVTFFCFLLQLISLLPTSYRRQSCSRICCKQHSVRTFNFCFSPTLALLSPSFDPINNMDDPDTTSQPRGVKRPAQSQKRGSSCAECRRLKLKCDRGSSDSWPCVQCRRRKCAELCPGSVSTPTAKAGNEKLLRLYRNKIADLESRLSATSVPSASSTDHLERTTAASSGSSFDPSTTLLETRASPTIDVGSLSGPEQLLQGLDSMPPPGERSPHHRTPSLIASPSSSAVRNDLLQNVAAQATQDASDQADEPMDHLYWPEDTSAQAPSLAHAANTAPSSSASGPAPALTSASDEIGSNQASVPSGPTFFGRSAGALYQQSENGNVSPVSSNPTSHIDSASVRCLPLIPFLLLPRLAL